MHSLIEQAETTIQQFLDLYPQGVVIIRGATATGKTGLSIELANIFPVEIISADSRQIYQGMNIGTDTIDSDIRNRIPHHMIDIVCPDQTFTAGEWKQQVEGLIPQIHDRDNIPFIVGGTGLYIDTIYKNFSMPDVVPDLPRRETMMQKERKTPGYLYDRLQHVDPTEAMKHHPNSTRYLLRALEICEKTGKTKTQLARQHPVQRPLLMIGLRREKEETNRRINARIKEMIAEGLVEEVQGLLDQGYTLKHTAMNGIGYKEIVGYLNGEYSLQKAQELLRRNSHRYAKRQRSRFRRYIAESKQTPKENVTYQVYML